MRQRQHAGAVYGGRSANEETAGLEITAGFHPTLGFQRIESPAWNSTRRGLMVLGAIFVVLILLLIGFKLVVAAFCPV